MGGDRKKRNLIIGRIVADVLLFSAVLFAHWAVVVLMGLVCLIAFPRFYEAVIAGVLLDLLYGAPIPKFLNITVIFTVTTLVMYFVVTRFKTQLRSYD